MQFQLGPAPLQSVRQPPLEPSSHFSDPTTCPSPQTEIHLEPFYTNPILHEQLEGAIGDPDEQVNPLLEPVQFELQPPEFPSSQTSFPSTFPSPQIGLHSLPERTNPDLHVQTDGVVELPPVH